MPEKLTDQLSWEKFYEESKKRSLFPKKVGEFNRLVAHTKNFFVISGYGAFTKGYLLIISKDFIPSFGLVEENKINELNFLILLIKEIIKEKFNRKSVVFEHGMCACVGGLDRAHLHIMSINNNSNESSLSKAIELALYSRKAGIKYIKYKNFKLENIHDINQIFESLKEQGKKNKDFKIVGKLLGINDIKDLTLKKWPIITLNHINKGGHYVYFNSGFEKSSFLTTHNFQTQFGREVVFYNELKLNSNFKRKIKKIEKKNKFIETWKWQNCMFESNILQSIKLAKRGFKHLKEKYSDEYFKYNIETI